MRFYSFRRKAKSKIFAHPSFKVNGASNVNADNLWLGLHYRGFESSKDIGVLNVNGKLIAHGFIAVGKGCRFDIAEKASVEIGKDSYINSNSKVLISEGLTIGDNCAIAWDCQFLDNDFHEILIDGKSKPVGSPISIGNHVWIGSGVKIYKGVTIPNNCVVAADSSVKSKFTEENCLIAGNPAKVIKRNVSWK